MAEAVYLLCAVTSIACAMLLFRGYRRNATRLLFWSSLCFMGLALNNSLLFVDQVLTYGTSLDIAGVPLGIVRSLIALASIVSLVYALILDLE